MPIFLSTVIAASVLRHAGISFGHRPDDSLTFVVAGDDRVEYNKSKEIREGDNYQTGVNEKAMGELWKEIFADTDVKFVLFSGDLVAGELPNSRVTSDLSGQLSGWEALLKKSEPSDRKVPVYPVRGNHENSGSADAWKAFCGEMTQYFGYGDLGVSSASPFNYTYSPTPDVLIVGLDAYSSPSGQNFVDTDWLKAHIPSPAPKHVFVFMHPMSFFTGGHFDHIGQKDKTLAPKDMTENRDKFLQILEDSGCEYLFCGHDHLLDAVDMGKIGWGHPIRQIVAGTAGAPFYTFRGTLPTHIEQYTLSNRVHLENTLGYLRVQVNGDDVKVTFKSAGRPDLDLTIH